VRFLVRAWGIRSTKDGITRAILQGYRRAGIEIASASFEIARIPPMTLGPAAAEVRDGAAGGRRERSGEAP
jgi:hypothetical protein